MGAEEGDEIVGADCFGLEEGDELVGGVVDAGEEAVLISPCGIFAADEGADAGAEGAGCGAC